MPVYSTGFPVAAKPRSSPLCVPRIVHRAATWSPWTINSSNVHSRSGSAVRKPLICFPPSTIPIAFGEELRHDVQVAFVVDLSAEPVDNGDCVLGALWVATGGVIGRLRGGWG